MQDLTGDTGKTYMCKTCEGRFKLPQSETAVCCPICRMNRFERIN